MTLLLVNGDWAGVWVYAALKFFPLITALPWGIFTVLGKLNLFPNSQLTWSKHEFQLGGPLLSFSLALPLSLSIQ